MSVCEIPLYQPDDTKLLRMTLTQDEWWRLAERAIKAEQTLEYLVNTIVQDAVKE